MNKLWAHQQKFIDANPDIAILAFEAGLGKTRVAIEWTNKRTYAQLVLIICPKAIKQKWKDDLVKWGCQVNSLVITKEEVKKIDVKTLPNNLLLVVDECFIAGTKVLTESGYKNIENVQVGDIVINAIGKGRVYKTFEKETSEELFTFILSDNTNFTCTGNHPILTIHGWKKAREVTINDELLHYVYSHTIINTYENMSRVRKWIASKMPNRQNFLYKILCKEIFNKTKNKKIKYSNKTLQKVQKTNWFIKRFYIPKRFLLGYMRSFTVDTKQSSTYTQSCKKIFAKNVDKQSNEKSFICRKNERIFKKNRAQTQNTRWKWTTYVCSAANIVGSTWRWLVCRTYCSNKKNISVPKQLQNRYCTPQKKDCYRNRWEQSWIKNKARARQEKRESIKTIRVESITIQKQSNTRVFNLSVEGHPSYVVNNVVVHNCHHITSPLFIAKDRSQVTEAVYSIIRRNEKMPRLFLTANPVRSSPANMHTLLYMSVKQIEWKKYQEYFYRLQQLPYLPRPAWMPKTGWQKEMPKLIAKYCHVALMKDCFDVPIHEYQTIDIPLSTETKQAIENVKKEQWEPVKIWHAQCRLENGKEKLEWIKEYGQGVMKLVVVCKYKEQIAQYAKELAKIKQTFVLTGDTKDQGQVIKDAQESAECFLIIQSQVCAGFDLDQFAHMIFASCDFSWVSFSQMHGRINRGHNLHTNQYVYLIGGSKDKSVLDALDKKEDFDISKVDNSI